MDFHICGSSNIFGQMANSAVCPKMLLEPQVLQNVSRMFLCKQSDHGLSFALAFLSQYFRISKVYYCNGKLPFDLFKTKSFFVMTD